MNVATILVSQEEAEGKLKQYKSVVGRRRLAEDDKLQSLYAAVSKGARVLNLAAAFKQVGLNEKGEPRIAIARADWKSVSFIPRRGLGTENWDALGGGGFTDRSQWDRTATARNIALPRGTFDNERLVRGRLQSPVPHVPPEVRPKYGLHNYHILFEVKQWRAYPVDPYLMRRISGMLFVVEAEWELTELEAALLSSMGT